MHNGVDSRRRPLFAGNRDDLAFQDSLAQLDTLPEISMPPAARPGHIHNGALDPKARDGNFASWRTADLNQQPFSPQTAAKSSRLRGAAVSHSICPYCAVGCSQLVYTKAGQIIDIEGNPESPINEGTLCPKGANTFQLISNPHRVTTVKYRAPHSDHWENRSLEWAMDRITQLVKKVRDDDFVERNADGHTVNHLKTIAHLGGATLDN